MSNRVEDQSQSEDRRTLAAVLACRNQGSRLYGKPLQNLDVEEGITILDNIIACLKTIDPIDTIVLAIADGVENEIFVELAKDHGIDYVKGDENDVLSRLIKGGQAVGATDIFRVTTESPFVIHDLVSELWGRHVAENADGTFLDEIVDGCGFEILRLSALETSHKKGDERHRSELCSLYLRENANAFSLVRVLPDESLTRKDLRLTVDNPEDLVVCRAAYAAFKSQAPRISVPDVVAFLDNHPEFADLVAPYTEAGYATMYVWGWQSASSTAKSSDV